MVDALGVGVAASPLLTWLVQKALVACKDTLAALLLTNAGFFEAAHLRLPPISYLWHEEACAAVF
jgi:hypothetical protein